MDETSKLISGLYTSEVYYKPRKYFSDAEKHLIIQEMLKTGCTKRDIWEKYTGQADERGHLLRWMRKLGYDNSIPIRRPNFAPNTTCMIKKGNDYKSEESFEMMQLQKRIAELEKQLKDAEMKAIALSTMVDIAEKELNISIRKKFNTKPSQK
jgi:hypothetical protein